MEAFYELSKSPPTHDFINWLSRVEEAAAGEKIQIRIVPGDRNFSQRDKFYTPERRYWRIQHLLMPLAWLLPSVDDVSIKEGEQTLSYANPGSPRKPIMKAPKHAVETVQNMLPKRAVTITLRNSDFERQRNTNLGEWMKVAEWLKNNGFHPIFIPDAEADMRGDVLDIPYSIYRAASHCVAIRLALYEQACMNLMTGSGVFVMAVHSDIPLLTFKMYVDGIPCCSESHIRKSGFAPEHDWSSENHVKRQFWEDDVARNIIPAIKQNIPVSLRSAA